MTGPRAAPRAADAAGSRTGPAAVYEAAGGDADLARAAWAFAHGMTILELDHRFPPGADLDAAWARGLDAPSGAQRLTSGQPLDHAHADALVEADRAGVLRLDLQVDLRRRRAPRTCGTRAAGATRRGPAGATTRAPRGPSRSRSSSRSRPAASSSPAITRKHVSRVELAVAGQRREPGLERRHAAAAVAVAVLEQRVQARGVGRREAAHDASPSGHAGTGVSRGRSTRISRLAVMAPARTPLACSARPRPVRGRSPVLVPCVLFGESSSSRRAADRPSAGAPREPSRASGRRRPSGPRGWSRCADSGAAPVG